MKGFDKQLFLEILKRYNSNKASKEEVRYLEAYYNLFEVNPDFINDKNESDVKDAVKAAVDQEIDLFEVNTGQYHQADRRLLKISFQRYAAAAIVLMVLSVGTYFILKKKTPPAANFAAYHDLSPGSNKAMLTLANGNKIVLGTAARGEIAKQPGISISNNAQGQIVYSVTAEKGEGIHSNTISTPKGGQYEVVLSDGTKVWLNSASSITYPATFDSRQRLVTLDGEAYFEVAKNKKSPFRIKTSLQTIEVLGTHFNVNSYADEPVMKTTLLEGAVKVSAGNDQAILIPGEQAGVSRSDNHINIAKQVDVDQVVAWKNGVFSFENEDLKSIMRQIARWYDVDVVYSSPVPDEKFVGEISRNTNLSEVCKILELNNVHFEIVGKTIKVSGNP